MKGCRWRCYGHMIIHFHIILFSKVLDVLLYRLEFSSFQVITDPCIQ